MLLYCLYKKRMIGYFFYFCDPIVRLPSSMDRISDSGSEDMGSNPLGVTIKGQIAEISFLSFFIFSRSIIIGLWLVFIKQKLGNFRQAFAICYKCCPKLKKSQFCMCANKIFNLENCRMLIILL